MATLTKNAAGGLALRRTNESKLAQIVCAGTNGGTYYVDAKKVEGIMKELANRVSPQALAKIAIYGRKAGYMKDYPALALAILATKDTALFRKTFPLICDNSKMLRNFVNNMRSGVVGRKSLGHAAKRMVQDWFASRTEFDLFCDSIGNKGVSIADVIRMAHPKPLTRGRKEIFAYILGKDHDLKLLPERVQQYEAFKKGVTTEFPKVPFQMLTGLVSDEASWKHIADMATWQQTRMLLNSFLKHGVFKDDKLTQKVADRLANRDLIAKSRVFPYQLFTAYKFGSNELPHKIKEALQVAMDISCENIPVIDGKVYICPDTSGSMSSAITGSRYAASRIRCIDVAAVMTAALIKKNPEATILPFACSLHNASDINPRDSIMTIAEKLARKGGGGTNCSLPLQKLNRDNAKGSAVIYISDYESWMDYTGTSYWSHRDGSTGMNNQWKKFVSRNPEAKLICVDLQPHTTAQADEDRMDTLLVGGFNDRVFDVVADFVRYGNRNWMDVIDGSVEL